MSSQLLLQKRVDHFMPLSLRIPHLWRHSVFQYGSKIFKATAIVSAISAVSGQFVTDRGDKIFRTAIQYSRQRKCLRYCQLATMGTFESSMVQQEQWLAALGTLHRIHPEGPQHRRYRISSPSFKSSISFCMLIALSGV